MNKNLVGVLNHFSKYKEVLRSESLELLVENNVRVGGACAQGHSRAPPTSLGLPSHHQPPLPKMPPSRGGSLTRERSANARNTSQHLSPSTAHQPNCTKCFSVFTTPPGSLSSSTMQVGLARLQTGN